MFTGVSVELDATIFRTGKERNMSFRTVIEHIVCTTLQYSSGIKLSKGRVAEIPVNKRHRSGTSTQRTRLEIQTPGSVRKPSRSCHDICLHTDRGRRGRALNAPKPEGGKLSGWSLRRIFSFPSFELIKTNRVFHLRTIYLLKLCRSIHVDFTARQMKGQYVKSGHYHFHVIYNLFFLCANEKS
jgi:hypothetical protein